MRYPIEWYPGIIASIPRESDPAIDSDLGSAKARPTTLIVPEHEFLFRFFSPDQSYLQSRLDFAVASL